MLKGILRWREEHAGEQLAQMWEGDAPSLARALREHDSAGCGCCEPDFYMEPGLRARLKGDALAWDICAPLAADMHFGYEVRDLGETVAVLREGEVFAQ